MPQALGTEALIRARRWSLPWGRGQPGSRAPGPPIPPCQGQPEHSSAAREVPGLCRAAHRDLEPGDRCGEKGGRRQPSLQGLQAFPEPLTPLPPFHRQLTKAEMGLSRDTGRLAATQGHMAGQAPARCGVTCWDSPLQSHANSQNPHVTQRPPALTRPG